MYWGGKDQDPVKMFDGCVNKFYGPVASEMRAFFSIAKKTGGQWRRIWTRRIAHHAVRRRKAGRGGTVFAKRVGLIDNFLEGLRSKAKMLEQNRGPVPSLRLVSGAAARRHDRWQTG